MLYLRCALFIVLIPLIFGGKPDVNHNANPAQLLSSASAISSAVTSSPTATSSEPSAIDTNAEHRLSADDRQRLTRLYLSLLQEHPAYEGSLDQGHDACGSINVDYFPFIDDGNTFDMLNDFDGVDSCTTSSASDVCYHFMVYYSGWYLISTEGSSYDTAIELRSGLPCPGPIQIDCDDDSGPAESSQMLVWLNETVYYTLIIDGEGSSSGPYHLVIVDDCEVDTDDYPLAECETGVGPNDCNGGCTLLDEWGQPTLYQTIQCGDSVHGTLSTYEYAGERYRDTDWYQFSLPDTGYFEIELSSEPFFEAAILSADCADPDTIDYWTSGSGWCFERILTTELLPPGNYRFFIATPNSVGADYARDYVFSLNCDLVGCWAEGEELYAPGTAFDNTCGAGTHCGLPGYDDITHVVHIPYDSYWDFALTAPQPFWQAELTVYQNCCDGYIASDAGGPDSAYFMNYIPQLGLPAGDYYVTIGADGLADSCGWYTLHVMESRARCCYGEPESPSCIDTTYTFCGAIGGSYSPYMFCNSNPCNPFAVCDEFSVFSQSPPVPDELWISKESDTSCGLMGLDNYTLTWPQFNSVTLWGHWTDYDGFPVLHEEPVEFAYRIFMDNSGDVGAEAVYGIATATGSPVHEFLSGVYYPTYEYTFEFAEPCTVSTGWISLYRHELPSEDLKLYMIVSDEGDHFSHYYWSDQYFDLPYDYSFCLGSTVEGATNLRLQYVPFMETIFAKFSIIAPGYWVLYRSTNPNAVFPEDYDDISAYRYTSEVHISQGLSIDGIFAKYIVVRQDTLPATDSRNPGDPLNDQ